MNRPSKSSAALIGMLSAVAGLAHATQPPDVVSSDDEANTAMGTSALLDLTTGYFNTAAGYFALVENTSGNYNTAFGAGALYANTGSGNTSIGAFALENNGSGASNTAAGYSALNSNTTGTGNTAAGYSALSSNSTGAANTAVGEQALYSNGSGFANVAIGQGALQANVTGSSNTAIGETSLLQATGSGNIAIGEKAGDALGSGSNNIYLANTGAAGDSGAIRIGSGSQTTAYVSGIYTTQLTGSAVYVTSSGQLGVQGSSERFKTDIAPMGGATMQLRQLRPVTFQLKTDPAGTRQYGLIAEEVDKVYPELVIRDGAGKIQGVRYEELAPMLLNEVQRQERVLSDQEHKLREVAVLKLQLRRQQQQLAELKQLNQSMLSVLAQLQTGAATSTVAWERRR